MTSSFGAIYKDKKVLITGHTGFKGSWLATWLLKLGAEIYGISKDIPTNPSMFEEIKLGEKIHCYTENINNLDNISKIISNIKPDFIFHLAAQPIVSQSYKDPIETLSTNIMGTANVLESIRHLEHQCVALIITSDKCYDNNEWVWGYRETDKLGGKDVYCGSKGAAELVFNSYYHSFFKNSKKNIRLATARAGNVIGGGDWAAFRITADCMRSWHKKQPVEIRNPNSIRPWQHVLEPLCGYLVLAKALIENEKLHGESFNFGPLPEESHTVKNLVEDLSVIWNFKNKNEIYKIIDNIPFFEATILKLNCDKALFHLKWQPNLNYRQTVNLVSEWYFKYYNDNEDMYEYTIKQISYYENQAVEKGLLWTK